MVMLTIEGLKKALNHIQDNSTAIRYYERGGKRGLIVTDGMSEDEAYHIRVVQLLQPKLITQLAESFTTLSLSGQELLDVLSDDAYLASLTDYLKRQGYTSPSDRQVFRLLQDRLAKVGSNPLQDVMYDALSRMIPSVIPEDFGVYPRINAHNAGNIPSTDAPAVEFADTVPLEQAAGNPTDKQPIGDDIDPDCIARMQEKVAK